MAVCRRQFLFIYTLLFKKSSFYLEILKKNKKKERNTPILNTYISVGLEVGGGGGLRGKTDMINNLIGMHFNAKHSGLNV